MNKMNKRHLPKTPEEALAHLIKIGMYKPPIVRHVRSALRDIGDEWQMTREKRAE